MTIMNYIIMKANDMRVGNIIKYKNVLYRVLGFQHVKPGKGGAFIQAELKTVLNNTKENKRFRSSETIEKPFIENKEYTCLFYNAADCVTLLNNKTYEEESVAINLFSKEQLSFLESNMIVNCIYCEGQIIECLLPKKIKVKIKTCDAFIKNQTATGSTKNAILENHHVIIVPCHVKENDYVMIDTEHFSYIELSKKS